MPQTYEVPLPTTVGGSLIGDPKKGRVTGPPSQKYPILRDLANAPATVTVEIDTENDRYVGVIDRVIPAPRRSPNGLPERLAIKSIPPVAAKLPPVQHVVKLPDILAFRVLKIEVSELPAVL